MTSPPTHPSHPPTHITTDQVMFWILMAVTPCICGIVFFPALFSLTYSK